MPVAVGILEVDCGDDIDVIGSHGFVFMVQNESIRLTNGPVTLMAVPIGGSEETKVSLGDFVIAGAYEDGSYLVGANGKVYVASPEAMDKAVTLDLSVVEAPVIADAKGLRGGDSGKPVINLQIALRTLGYYEGVAEGNYNKKTIASVTSFQEAMGLEATGEADAETILLATALAEEPIEMEGNVDPEVLYAPIIGKTVVDLAPIMESGMKFSYDEMSGEGFITDGTVVTADLSGASELEKAVVSLQIGFLTREKAGIIEVLPAAKVSCLCVRRPMMTSVTMKAGELRGSAEIGALTTRLDGIYTVEEGLCELSDEMVAALVGAEDAGELKIRIGGEYASFDLEMGDMALDGAAAIGKIATEME